MKRVGDLLSSGSSSDEYSPSSSVSSQRTAKANKMATGEAEITMRDLYVQLNSIKRDFDSNFGSLRMDIETLRLELQRDIELIRDDVEGVKTSIHKAWEDIEEKKSNLSSNGNRIPELSATCETLKDQLNAEKQRNLKLESNLNE